MIQSYINAPVALASNTSPIAFTNDRYKSKGAYCRCGGWLNHTEGSPLYKITEGGAYEITLTGTVTSAAAGIVALGVYEDGVLLPGTISAQTLAAAGDLASLTTHTTVKVCCNSGASLTIGAVPSVIAGATLVPTDTVVPVITNASLSIVRKG